MRLQGRAGLVIEGLVILNDVDVVRYVGRRAESAGAGT